MITRIDAQVMDANSEALGVSVKDLMDNAGAAVAEVIKKRFSGKKILFVCGTGNNGGDGFSAARCLTGEDVSIMLLKPKTEIHSKESIKELNAVSCPVKEFFSESAIEKYDVLVDCALGTGAVGSIRNPYDEYIEIVNRFKGIVISVDIPSGFGTDTAILPDITISFHAAKDGMNSENCGDIIIANIGIPENAYLETGPGDMRRYPIPSPDSHKGCNGRLLIIGGGPYAGAPAMAAMAAMRVGVDLVRIATPTSSFTTVSSFSPVFTMTELPGKIITIKHIKELLELTSNNDAVLIGPGIGIDTETVFAVREFVSKCTVPMVIDADGLNALGKDFHNEVTPIIVTPHSREFIRLGGTIGKDLVLHVTKKASDMNATILLKGAEDIISNGTHYRVNKRGTPAMTSAGTGDVLSGIVAGLLSKGMNTFDAACLGAYISGRAGEMAFEKRSYGLIATDVIDKISKVIAEDLRR
ncbi:MAG: NAD(P)H-hydrate dehydratase [Candidatus Methanomethylophilaceae archaeon]|nr:NAD(P)H-hydrate dehydratase [Candidatus Methanomethylophilaceae archaeon]